MHPFKADIVALNAFDDFVGNCNISCDGPFLCVFGDSVQQHVCDYDVDSFIVASLTDEPFQPIPRAAAIVPKPEVS